MNALSKFAREVAKTVYTTTHSAILMYPKRVHCNACDWSGRVFGSDSWHKYTICPKCRSTVRQRLLVAGLRHLESELGEKIFAGKRILHFAPEGSLVDIIRSETTSYITADYLRSDVDLRLNMCDMADVADGSFGATVALDVLEHVPDFRVALQELYRVLSPGSFAVLSVPQKDGLETTLEDPSITTPQDRLETYGQADHLRLFGSDFKLALEEQGFDVTTVDENVFPEEFARQNVLYPPILSDHPLATNYRKIFFCRKPK